MADLETQYNNEGINFLKLGRYSEALALFNKAITINPNDAILWHNRGYTLQILGRHAEALISSDKAITIKPDYANAWNNRGNVLYSLERYAEAVASYDKSLAIDPNAAVTRSNRGTALNELEKIEQIKHKQQDTEELFTHLQSNAKKLTRYVSLIPGFIAEAQEQIAVGNYDYARNTLMIKRVETTIDALLECESSIVAWNENGYNLTELEGLHPRDADELIAVIQKYRQNINRLETIAQELESKKSACPDLFEQPETADSIRSIELNLKNPVQIDTVEKDYQQLNNAICQLQDKQKIIEKNIHDQVEKVQREATSPEIKQEIDPIIKNIGWHDIPRAQELLQDLAGQQLTRVNAALSTLRTEGAVVSLSSDPIQEQIAAQNFGDAILDAEKMIVELTRIQEMYVKAKVLKPTVTEPEITTSRPHINLEFLYEQVSVTFDKWVRGKTISITNVGSEHAKNVTFESSDEVEFRCLNNTWEVPVGETKQLEIPIKANVKDSRPFVITVIYHDPHGNQYTKKLDSWIEVKEEVTEKLTQNESAQAGKSETPVQIYNIYHDQVHTGPETTIKNDGIIQRSTLGAELPIKKKVCPKCDEPIHDNENFCPNCQQDLR